MMMHQPPKILLVAFAVLALMLAMPVGSQSSENEKPTSHIEPNTVANLMAWVTNETGWTVREAPSIRFVSYADIVKIYSEGKGTDYHVESLYSETDHTIYLPNSWRSDDLRDRSILLHELVHHLQYLNNVKVICSSESEWQALELQVTWLRQQEVEDPLDFLGINPRFLLMLQQCE